jgi:hypothetical protein
MKKILLIFVISLFMGNLAFGQSYREMKKNYYQAGSPKVRSPLSPTVATLFSFLIPGLGQIYAGEYLRGTGFLLGNIATNIVALAGLQGIGETKSSNCAYGCSSENSGLIGFGLLAGIGITIWSMVDASKVTHVKNFNKTKASQQENKETSFLPQISPVLIQSQNQLSPGIGLLYNF